MVLVDLYGGGWRSTAEALTHDAVADESRKMADGVARSQSRLCSRDGYVCCYGDALSTMFLLAFVPCFPPLVFRFFISLFFFPACRYVYLVPVGTPASCMIFCPYNTKKPVVVKTPLRV